MKIKQLITVFMLLLTLSLSANSEIDYSEYGFDVSHTVYRVAVDEGVSMDDVKLSILSKAAELNLKFVSHQPLSDELHARGVKSAQIDIFQFCNPEEARTMIDFNIIFVAYMPCRIAIVEDSDLKPWLMMINLDMLLGGTKLSPETKALADKINNKLKTVIDFAKSGDF